MQIQHAGRLVAIVDDDNSVRTAVGGLLRSIGVSAEVFASAEEFLRSAKMDQIGCLVVDANMPKMSGLDLHQTLLGQGNSIPTIVITAYPSDHVRARAQQTGVHCLLTKPFNEDELLSAIRNALASAGR
ncbi:response regulator transcription factor [Bradyrhizobium iriomotense]|uniref:Response regulator n=1 Tax=Bradyrhizobium iriomotense TaxID=441950 RepID=A0ABQ6ASK2_9BRAD|nr:response regulator [Bradyrhizobium iriomotense]GLR84420.1 response regulator [Bradyrhizobium iriomotense]